MGKELAAWGGVLLFEIAVTRWVGPVAAIGAAVPLLLYAFGDRSEAQQWLDRVGLSLKNAIWIGIGIAIATSSFDVGRRYYEPYRVAKLVTLFERDPESWPGHATDAQGFTLDDSISPGLRIRVGERRRFNPQLRVANDADNLRDVIVFFYFPLRQFGARESIDVPLPEGELRWQETEDRRQQHRIYYLTFGDSSKGSSGAPGVRDVMYLTPSHAGDAEITYVIRGVFEQSNKAFQVRRSFRVSIDSPNP